MRLFAAQIAPDEARAMSAEAHGQAFMAYVAGMLANAPGQGRRRRMVYTVFIPAPETPTAKRTRAPRRRRRQDA